MFVLILILLSPAAFPAFFSVSSDFGVRNSDVIFKDGSSQVEFGASDLTQSFRVGHDFEIGKHTSLMLSGFHSPAGYREKLMGLSVVEFDITRGSTTGADLALKWHLDGLSYFALVGMSGCLKQHIKTHTVLERFSNIDHFA